MLFCDASRLANGQKFKPIIVVFNQHLVSSIMGFCCVNLIDLQVIGGVYSRFKLYTIREEGLFLEIADVISGVLLAVFNACICSH